MLPNSFINFVYRLRHRPDPRFIASDVDYALEMTRTYLAIAEHAKINLNRAHVLEIGPGASFASQLVFASYGASVTVADPFLVDWDPKYHSLFYRAFRDRLNGPTGAIDKAIANGSYTGILACIHEPAESLSPLIGQDFDLILSNAVLEHTRDPIAVCKTLAKLTKQNGMQTHQIDYRDHLNRAQPLEFLAKTDVNFWLQRTRHPSQANRKRHGEWLKAFEAAGLSIEAAITSDFADETYLNDFVPRLRRSTSSYHAWPIDDLRILGARINLRRPRGSIGDHDRMRCQ
jgi:hypothetical protein